MLQPLFANAKFARHCCCICAGLRTEFLNQNMISLSNDTIAIVDRAEKGKGKAAEHEGFVAVLKHLILWWLCGLRCTLCVHNKVLL